MPVIKSFINTLDKLLNLIGGYVSLNPVMRQHAALGHCKVFPSFRDGGSSAVDAWRPGGSRALLLRGRQQAKGHAISQIKAIRKNVKQTLPPLACKDKGTPFTHFYGQP